MPQEKEIVHFEDLPGATSNLRSPYILVRFLAFQLTQHFEIARITPVCKNVRVPQDKKEQVHARL
jgi:hypothetical protein